MDPLPRFNVSYGNALHIIAPIKNRLNGQEILSWTGYFKPKVVLTEQITMILNPNVSIVFFPNGRDYLPKIFRNECITSGKVFH